MSECSKRRRGRSHDCLRSQSQWPWDEVIGIEREAEYVAIAEARLTRWDEVPAHVDPAVTKPAKADAGQPSLFDAVTKPAKKTGTST